MRTVEWDIPVMVTDRICNSVVEELSNKMPAISIRIQDTGWLEKRLIISIPEDRDINIDNFLLALGILLGQKISYYMHKQ